MVEMWVRYVEVPALPAETDLLQEVWSGACTLPSSPPLANLSLKSVLSMLSTGGKYRVIPRGIFATEPYEPASFDSCGSSANTCAPKLSPSLPLYGAFAL